MKIKAIVLAGGSGKRLGSDVPKQYINIGKKPVLSYALEAFQKSCADEIVIAAGKEYTETCRRIASDASVSKLTAVIEGGSERYYSVMNGLTYLRNESSEPCIVLIHDGARPFVTPQLIHDVTDAVTACGAAIAALPCTDTIKITDEEGMIVSTTNRSLTWAAQTPQGFWLEDIYRAYDQLLSGDGSSIRLSTVTDDAMVYQLAFPGRKVKAVLSSPSNIKITRALDLTLAETILGE